MVRILIIEDDDVTAKELRSWLLKEGYRVDLAKTGSEGVKQLQKIDYDVAVVDSQLPDMDGTEICRSASAANLVLPVMMLSSRGDIEEKIKALDSGAQDFLEKPCQLPELSARLRSLLRRYAKSSFVHPFVSPANLPVIP